jgi:hypothetical protein
MFREAVAEGANMTRALLVLGSMMLMVACASTAGKNQKTALAKQDRAHPDTSLICEMERPTGSNIQVRVCREPEAIQTQREATQNYMRDLQRPGPHKTDG